MNTRGLESELEDLYRRRNSAFQVMLASVTGSVESASDVVQEAFARALRDQDGYRGEGSLEAWVWRIAFRVAIGSRDSRELVGDEVPRWHSSTRAAIHRSQPRCANCRRSAGWRSSCATSRICRTPTSAKCSESPKELSRRRWPG